MAQDLFAPRPDMVDGELFIKTPQTARASTSQWRLLDLTRREPRPWMPTVVVLCGEHGSSLTTIAERFVMASRRNIACHQLHKRIVDLAPEQARRAADAKTHAAEWATAWFTDMAVPVPVSVSQPPRCPNTSSSRPLQTCKGLTRRSGCRWRRAPTARNLVDLKGVAEPPGTSTIILGAGPPS